MSVDSGGGSKVILNLDAGASGVQAGSTYTGTVNVVAGGITDNMYVTLKVPGQCDPTCATVTPKHSVSTTLEVMDIPTPPPFPGQCDPTSAYVNPKSLTFQANVGGQNPSAQTLRVIDNCADAVSATVLSKPNWLTLTQTGTGVFSVSCVASYLQEGGSYSGSITLEDGFDQQHSVSATLEVMDTQSSAQAIDVPENQQAFIISPVISPVVSSDPAQACPIGVGEVAENGDNLHLRVQFEEFSGPVDIYVGIYVPTLDENSIYMVRPDRTISSLAQGLVAWKSNVTQANESIFGDIPLSSLPPGPYTFYVVVTPPGSLESYYFYQSIVRIPEKIKSSSTIGPAGGKI